MSPLFIALLVFICIFSTAMLALMFRVLLPQHHLNSDTMDTVKISMGIVATLSALVLGLLIASAKESNNSAKNEITAMVAKVVFTDRLLSLYGPDAAKARISLRIAVEHMKERLWPDNTKQSARLDPPHTASEAAFKAIEQLVPQNDEQKALKARALENVYDLGQMSWLLFEQVNPSISKLMLIIVISWLAILFFSFGLFAPGNGTAITSIMFAAMSVAGAIFLLLELDEPFGGLIRISSQSIVNALGHLGQ
jgi:hypothetical protein